MTQGRMILGGLRKVPKDGSIPSCVSLKPNSKIALITILRKTPYRVRQFHRP